MDEFLNEILAIIRSDKSKEEKKELLENYHASDLADVIEKLDEEERNEIEDILDTEHIAEILYYLDNKAEVLEQMKDEDVADVIELMDADDAVDILQELDEKDRNNIIELMDEEAKEDVQLILSFEEDQIGSIMTTNFITICKGDSVKTAMKKVVQQASENDNITTIFVVDEANKFHGTISLTDLICAREGDNLEEITKLNYPYFYATDDVSESVNKLKEYNEDIIPVLDESDEIIGVITSNDVIELIRDEAADDYNKLAGVLEEEELDESVFQSMKKRIPWLALLLILGLVVSLVISRFSAVITVVSAAVFFQSVVFDMAGNGGTQSLAVTLTTITQNQEISAKKFRKMLFKELRVGLCNGLLLGTLSFLAVLAFLCITHQEIVTGRAFAVLDALKVSSSVGIALLCALTFSSMFGLLLPMFFKKIKIDPAVASGPMITTINDICSACIYYILVALFFVLSL